MVVTLRWTAEDRVKGRGSVEHVVSVGAADAVDWRSTQVQVLQERVVQRLLKVGCNDSCSRRAPPLKRPSEYRTCKLPRSAQQIELTGEAGLGQETRSRRDKGHCRNSESGAGPGDRERAGHDQWWPESVYSSPRGSRQRI